MNTSKYNEEERKRSKKKKRVLILFTAIKNMNTFYLLSLKLHHMTLLSILYPA